MARQPRRLARQGTADLPTRAAVNAYIGPNGEPIFDGETLRMHDGVTRGGIPLARRDVAVTGGAFPVRDADRAKTRRTIFDYGLVPGTTDITAALAEIRKAADSPVVFIPEGVYTLTPQAVTQYFASNVSFRGAGRGRTVIQLVGPALYEAVFAWSNATGVSLCDLTVDVNTLPSGRPGALLAGVMITANVRDIFLDRVEFKNMKGDRVVGWFALKSQFVEVDRSRFAFVESHIGATGGIVIDNSYFGSDSIGRISGRTMTITEFRGRGAPEGLYPGLHLQGKGVPLNCSIVRQISGPAGQAGTYEITHAANVPDGTRINGVANDDWVVRNTEFHRCILQSMATRFVSESNYYNGWGSGCSLILDYNAVGAKSINDRFRDGNYSLGGQYLPDVFGLWGDGIECHADHVQVINPDAENLSNGLIGLSGDNVRVEGGRVRKFAQASIHDATLIGSTSGNQLTVASVSAGIVLQGQVISGPGIPAQTSILSNDGNGVYTLSKSVTASASNQAFTTAAPIGGGVFRLQRIGNLNNSSANFEAVGVNIQGSGTPGERCAVFDQDRFTGANSKIVNLTVSGLSEGPYRISGSGVVVDLGAALSAAQLALVAPNVGTVLGVSGVGLTAAGVVSGSGSVSGLAFGDGSKFNVVAAPSPWTTYTPTFTPFGGSGVTVANNRASYEIVGKTLRVQMRFQVSWASTGSAPGFVTVSLPSGVTLKDSSAGSLANASSGNGGFVSGGGGGNTVNAGGGSGVFGDSGNFMILSMVAEIN